MASDTSGTVPLADVADLARLVQGVDAILNQRNIDEETFRFVSAAAVDRLGYPLERWLTEPGFWLNTLVHPEERDRVTRLLEARVETAGSSVLEYRAIRADGAVVWLRDHIVVDHTEEGRHVVRGVILDITDIREAEAAAERSYRAIELLKEIAEQANLAETGEAVITAVLGRVKHHLGMHVAHAYVRPRQSAMLVPLRTWYAATGMDAAPLQEASEPLDFSEGFIGRVASTGEPLWLEDVARSDLFLRRDAAAAIGIRTAVAVPVLAGETTAAVLEFFSTRPIPPDSEVLDLLASVGTSLGRAFEWEWNASEIRERERRLREAQRTARLGGWRWDHESDRITLSEELFEVLGQRCEDLSSAALLAFAGPDDQRAFRAALDAVTRGEDFEVEPTLHIPGRDPLVLHVRGRVYADPTGRRRVEGTAQDVTQRRAAERTARDLEIERRARQRAEAVQAKLVRTAAALARSNRQLDEFAYIASHDLKAPLRGIANLVRYLEEDIESELTDDTRNLMELLQTRVRWMQELIDGILRFSRAGRERVAPEDIGTRPLIEQILSVLPEGPEVTIAVEPDAATLRTPVAPLRQVLLNLISNACRYAPEEGGTVDVAVVPTEDDQVRFSVRDNGPGIAPEFQDRIWAIFQTLEARDSGGGSGIGLAVVRKLVEQHGGRAWVESMPGEGATFHFTWPRTFAAEEET